MDCNQCYKLPVSFTVSSSPTDRDFLHVNGLLPVWGGGPGVGLTLCCFVVCSTRRFVVCRSVCRFVLVFFSPFGIAITSLGEERANLVLFVRLFRLCLFRFVGFLFLLGSGKGCGLWLWHSLDFSLTFFSDRGLHCLPLIQQFLDTKASNKMDLKTYSRYGILFYSFQGFSIHACHKWLPLGAVIAQILKYLWFLNLPSGAWISSWIIISHAG